MEDDIKMKPINLNKEEQTKQQMKESILAEEEDVIIWFGEDPEGKSVFINVGNATTSMPESVFYTLTKLTQIATKKLLGID